MSYKIVKQVWTPDGMECEHALCDPLHKAYHVSYGYNRWYCNKPMAPRTEWIIENTETNRFIDIDGVGRFDLKRDAVKALKYYIKENTPTIKEVTQ